MSAYRPSAVGGLLVLLFSYASCEPSGVSNGIDPAPNLVLLDSIELHESGTDPLGRPGTLLSLDDGGYLLADVMTERVLEYDAQGGYRRTLGGQGRGPGEFQRLGPIALDGDSVLYVLDGETLNVLDYRTGQYREKALLPAVYSQSIVAQGAKVYFRSADSAQTPYLAGWKHEGIIQGPVLPAASELEPVKATGATEIARMMNATHSWAVFGALKHDTIAVLSQSSEDVLIATLERVVARFPVARTRRQGVRADLLAQMAANPDLIQRDPQIVYTSSIPVMVARDNAGQLVSIKADQTFLTDRISAKRYLSVTDPRSGLTCPDALVPGPEDPAPVLALRGDTLLVLTHEIRGTEAVALIRRYVIRTAECRWIKAGAA